MARIAFVTCTQYPALTADDRVAADLLRARGVDVVPAIWSEPVDWGTFDLIVLRSMWDYHLHIDRFELWLDALEPYADRVLNPIPLARWNSNKLYLRDLRDRGVPIVPTSFHELGTTPDLCTVLDQHGWDEVVVKPLVSSTAFSTWRIRRDQAAAEEHAVHALLRERAAMIQQYQPEIISEGEWSSMFVDGRLTHIVLKRAATGDFRVQEEFGGTTELVPAPAAVREAAYDAIAAIEGDWLYARVDGVNTASGFRLGELEVLEPGMFFLNSEDAAYTFAAAIVGRLP